MLINLEDAKKAMLKQQAIDLRDPALIGISFDGDLACEILDRLPSAQPEIIRCRDCNYWDKTWENDRFPDYHYCPMIDGFRKGNFYCGDGERRGEQAEGENDNC